MNFSVDTSNQAVMLNEIFESSRFENVTKEEKVNSMCMYEIHTRRTVS